MSFVFIWKKVTALFLWEYYRSLFTYSNHVFP